MDANATTPLVPEVVEAMRPWLLENFGNASSIHQHGQRARAAVERARESVARLLNCRESEIVFTSGGTESDNMAVFSSEAIGGAGRSSDHIVHRAPRGAAYRRAPSGSRRRGDVSAGFARWGCRCGGGASRAPTEHTADQRHDGQQRNGRHPAGRRDRAHCAGCRRLVSYRCGAGGGKDRDRCKGDRLRSAEHLRA